MGGLSVTGFARLRWRRVVTVPVTLSTLVSCVPDRPVHDALDAVLATGPCATEVRSLVSSWGGGSRLLAGPSMRGGRAAYRIPAGPIGHWIVLDPGADGSTRVSRWTDGPDEARVFHPGRCDGLVERAAPFSGTSSGAGVAATSLFTDTDLRRLVGNGGSTADDPARRAVADALVVYAWSPHMPLSVDGYAEIRSAAAALGLRVAPVLIAGGNRDFARREAQRVKMPEEGLREVASVELFMRDMQVHAPSILVFGDDRVSPVLPGYRNAEGYRRYLEAFLRR